MVKRKDGSKAQEVKVTKKTEVEEPEVTTAGSSRLMRTRRVGGTKRTFWFVIFLVIFLGVGWFATKAIIASLDGDSGFWTNLFGNNSIQLVGEDSGRVNVLLMGHPGGDDTVDGPFLTDTIMVASYNVADNYLHIFSIPRDTYVQIEDYGMSKINGVFQIGESKLNDGPGTAMKVVGDLVGLDIPYYIKIDFEGFEQMVDELGGVTIDVARDLNDPYYPTPDKGYETLDIPAGTYTMDGKMALKYARSRKTTSDFDRARRQQDILVALRSKALGLELLTAPSKVLEIGEIVKDHFSSNLKPDEVERALEIMTLVESDNIYHKVFDDGPNGMLYGTKVDGIFVLKPVDDDYAKISDFVSNALTQVGSEVVDENINLEPLKIEVLNGTNITGLASRTREKLESAGFEVVNVGNSPTKGFADSVVYDGTGGARFSAINKLTDLMNATVSDDVITPGSGADVRLILGSSAE